MAGAEWMGFVCTATRLEALDDGLLLLGDRGAVDGSFTVELPAQSTRV